MFLINPFRDPKPVLPVSNRHTEILLRSHPDYVCSPLLELPALAADLGIGNLSLKDERQRLRLGSFKGLGGFSAIAELVMRETGIGPEEIYTINACYAARQLTFCCASSGNHGKAVAAAAGLLGAKAIVFVPEKLSARRLQGITDQQARVILVPGSYDQAVARAYHQAIANNWILVPDTSEDAADPVVGFVMDGYRVMAKELFSQLSQPPTHLFVQGGVGGMAAAMATEFRAEFPDARLSIIIVEPENAACLMESIRAGHPVSLKRQAETGISMLACYRPSVPAWNLLRTCADAFMTISDTDAEEALPLLEPIHTSTSGAAGLAGLIRLIKTNVLPKSMELDTNSRVLIFITES